MVRSGGWRLERLMNLLVDYWRDHEDHASWATKGLGFNQGTLLHMHVSAWGNRRWEDHNTSYWVNWVAKISYRMYSQCVCVFVCRSLPGAGGGCRPWGSYVKLLTKGDNGIQGPVPVQNECLGWLLECMFPLRGFYPGGLETGTGGGHWCCLHLPECCVFCLC